LTFPYRDGLSFTHDQVACRLLPPVVGMI